MTLKKREVHYDPTQTQGRHFRRGRLPDLFIACSSPSWPHLGVIVPLAPEYNMGGFLRRNELNAFVSQSAHVNPLEQSLSPAQQDRRDSDVQLIDEAHTKILLDGMTS